MAQVRRAASVPRVAQAGSSTGTGSTGETVSGDTGHAVDPASAVRADLVAIAATAARFGPSTVQRALDVLGASSDAQWSTGGSRQQSRHADASRPTGHRPTTSVQTAAIQAGSVEVDSALPFLLLRPLSMIGYLDALGPALSVTRVPDATAAFATCLAYAVLGSLDRGWRRAAGDRTAAAVFAGLEEPLPEPGLVGFVRAAAPALPGLDAVLARSLADGHSAGQPLLLTAVAEACGGGLLLFDVEGLFPIAWADTVEDLLPSWSACGAPLVLLRPTELPAGTPDRLHRNGVTFVADAPPIRHERWRRLNRRLHCGRTPRTDRSRRSGRRPPTSPAWPSGWTRWLERWLADGPQFRWRATRPSTAVSPWPPRSDWARSPGRCGVPARHLIRCSLWSASTTCRRGSRSTSTGFG